MREYGRWIGIGVLLLLAGLFGLYLVRVPIVAHALVTVEPMSGNAPVQTTGGQKSGGGGTSILGAPSLSSTFIDQVLAHAGSPAAGLGQVFYEESQRTGIDDVFPLGIFRNESTYGTQGIAAHTHSVGNIRCAGYAVCFQGFRQYGSWAEGIRDLYQILAQGYVARGATTLERIMPVYAPAADQNDPAGYIGKLKTWAQSWRDEQRG